MLPLLLLKWHLSVDQCSFVRQWVFPFRLCLSSLSLTFCNQMPLNYNLSAVDFFLLICSDSLSFLNLRIGAFHELWKIFSFYLFELIYLAFSQFSPLGNKIRLKFYHLTVIFISHNLCFIFFSLSLCCRLHHFFTSIVQFINFVFLLSLMYLTYLSFLIVIIGFFFFFISRNVVWFFLKISWSFEVVPLFSLFLFF